jgi:hypothetical protein
MPKRTGKTVAQRASGIRVVSDGTLPGTKIFNAKTGKALGLVKSLDIHFDVDEPIPYAVLKVYCPETFVEIDNVKTMRNGSVDEPVCKQAKDCRERLRLSAESKTVQTVLGAEEAHRTKKVSKKGKK